MGVDDAAGRDLDPRPDCVPRGAVFPSRAALAYAVDTDERLLRILRAASPANVRTVVAAPGDPRFPPGSTDTIFLCDALHNLPNRPQYCPKLDRALRAGGRIIVIDRRKSGFPLGLLERAAVGKHRNRRIRRGGYGLYHDRIFQGQFDNSVTNVPCAISSQSTGLPFRLAVPLLVDAASPAVWVLDPSFRVDLGPRRERRRRRHHRPARGPLPPQRSPRRQWREPCSVPGPGRRSERPAERAPFRHAGRLQSPADPVWAESRVLMPESARTGLHRPPGRYHESKAASALRAWVPGRHPEDETMSPPAPRKTRQKTAIRAAFEQDDRPLSSREVFQHARKGVRGLGIATVYRNLRSLVEEGWLTPVEMPGGAVLYEMAGKRHHHHFQCDRCNRVFEVWGCMPAVHRLAGAGFKVDRHDLVLYGTCASCRGSRRR